MQTILKSLGITFSIGALLFIAWNLNESRLSINRSQNAVLNSQIAWSEEQALYIFAGEDSSDFRRQIMKTNEAIKELGNIRIVTLLSLWNNNTADTLHSIQESRQQIETWYSLKLDEIPYPRDSARTLTENLNQLAAEFNSFIIQQSRYFQNLNLFISALLFTSVFFVFTYSRRNRQLLVAEKRAHQLSRYLISDYEKRMHSIALDLHDDIAQKLYLLRMEENRQNRETHLDSAIEKIRRLSYDIRPGKAASLPLGKGIQSLLSDLAGEAGWKADYSETGIRNMELPYDLRIHLYRIVQEALQNIRKHARASAVELRILLSFPHLKISIRDNGTGFDTEKEKESTGRGMGLRGMQERAAILGGHISISSKQGRGTTVEFLLSIQDYIKE